ncbi:hypothetical protein [Thiomicrorhabdus xiamenensis]|uniref:Uncharacterized protein n=1 Tax=Thiomicrorhabdus xiamenensis TaxID=2739063 RepID=A0A7D4NK92_9GAMM|nr:hypothetical protein [Thiomicrorhabdus xiamenensis]QKI88194.1 hypothetical protein HQN79_00700 [Thiomicrorhabdus xiamenensis]
MRIFGFISIIVWLLIFIALAIMFDWFGSRDLAKSAVQGSEEVIEYLEKTGDSTMSVIDSVSDEAKDVKEDVHKATE